MKKYLTLALLVVLLQYSTEDLDIPEGKIVGGENCEVADNPFMVSIKSIFGLKHICGGTLINSAWVLTAAHCGVNYQARPGSLVVVAGVTHVRADSTQWSEVDRIVIHNNFNYPTRLSNDIGVLRLYYLIYETDYVRFVKLPMFEYKGDLDRECKTADIVGWGDQKKPSNRRTSKTELIPLGRSSNHLQCGVVTVINHVKCLMLYPDPIEMTAICAVESKGTPCFGDSGGPLLCKNVQYGIVSAGYGCSSRFPTIYTRVDKFLEFIWNAVNGSARNEIEFNFLSIIFVTIVCVFICD